VTPCIPRCDPVECDVTDYHGDNQRLSSFGRRKRRSISSIVAQQLQQPRRRQSKSLENDENVMVAGVIHISDKFELGDKTSTSKPSSEWNDVVHEDCSNNGYQPDGMNSFGFAIGATLFLLAQCVLIGVWICIYQRQKSMTSQNSASNSSNDDEAVNHVSGNFGTLFPVPPGISVKSISPPDFRDYNPYTADLFRRRPNMRENIDCEDENNDGRNLSVGDFPSLHSISSIDSSINSVGCTTMYASLVNPKTGGNCKPSWAKRNFGSVFSAAESPNPTFEEDEPRRA